MNRSKGTYLQGVKSAGSLLEKYLESGEEPSYYYDGKDYCNGFYDYIHYYLDNEELIVNHFKGVDSEI